VMKQAVTRSWKQLARERIEDTKPTIPLGSKFWPLRTAAERAAFHPNAGPADWRSHSADACVLVPRRHAGHVRHAPSKQLHGPSQPAARSARKRILSFMGPSP
jgi:hypothetical protein